MDSKPKLNLTLSSFDRNLDFLSKIFLVALWFLTLFVILKLPTIIPTHFNDSGKPDDYGNKNSILLLPVLATLINFLLSWLNKRPHLFNYGVKVTLENAQQQYTQATRMLRFLKLAIIIIVSILVLLTYLTSLGKINGLGTWFLPVIISLLMLPVIISIIIAFKQK